MSSIHGVIGRARVIFAALLYFCFAGNVHAMPANPNAFPQVQPDGTRVMLHVRGDEHFNWAEDQHGYTVLINKGWYEYARLNARGKLVPSGLKVGKNNPKAYGLEKRILPSPAQRAASVKDSTSSSEAITYSAPVSGTLRNLVILVQFSNHVGRALPSVSEVDVLFNSSGGDPVLAPTGSVRDVYQKNSYGQLDLLSDVAAWITVSNSEQYYANGDSGDQTLWEALREALDLLDSNIDFSQYDANRDGLIDSITFLHSGYGAEWGDLDEDGVAWPDRIWSHKWSMSPGWVSKEGVGVGDYHISPALWGTRGSNIGRIGVIAHETGHFLGLPDLYDTDGGGSGIGSYGLMANSWGFDGTQKCPPHFSPWSKLQLGWINPDVISQSGEYSLSQSETDNEYFIVSAGYAADEYLMIENRQNAGFDCSLPQGGLAVWHIDDATGFNTEGYPAKRWPRNGDHYRVALAQADGNFNLEKGDNRGDSGDVHHAGGVDAVAPGPDGHPNTDGYQDGRIVYTGHTISNVSASGPVMTFCLNGCGGGVEPDPDPDPTGGYEAPTGLAASVETIGKAKSITKNATLVWADNSNGTDNEDVFIVERCVESGKGKNKVCNFSQHAVLSQDVNLFSESLDSDTYKYRVKARRGSGDDTAFSNEVKI